MSVSVQGVRRIAILGKSHDLWPVAALIAKDLPARLELVVVEDADSVEPAAVSIRLDDPFLARLGISSEELVTADSALFSLGTELRDWQGDGGGFFLTGSGGLPTVDEIAIHQIMLRAALSYDQPDRLSYLYQPFRLPARAMEAGKFAFQSADPRSPLSMLRPTVQIDQVHYTALLKNRFGSGRTKIIHATPKAAQSLPDSGAIRRVELDNGDAIEADFFVDVSGALGSLIGGLSRLDWHSISEGLPFDRILSAGDTGPPVGTARHVVAQAIKGGLIITTPLRDSSIAQLVYASSHLTDEEEQNLVGSEADVALFEPGYVGCPWIENLVTLGSAAGCFGPFLSADLTLLQRQACILADHLPKRLDMTVEAGEYNRRHLIAAEQVRDYVLFPFALNRRDDALWSEIRESKLPERLRNKIDQFRSRGRFAAFEGEIFDEQSWIDLMIGFGIVPERYDPMAQALDMASMPRRLKNLTGAFDQALAQMPAYEDFISNSGADAPQ